MGVEDYNHIRDEFNKSFGLLPDVTSVAPGRVNLIGEHVDHQGYAVLPTAIGFTIQVAVSKKDYDGAILEIRHVTDRFTPVKYDTLSSLVFPRRPHWANYVLAALFGLCEYEASNRDLNEVGSPVTGIKGLGENAYAQKALPQYSFRVMVDGKVPVAAGVSSSSALVVASASAFMKALGLTISRLELAELCANCERHVGVAGGGMDQASICLSRPGGAQLIEFSPLKAETVLLPPNAALVVCNTCREAPKMETAAIYYNKRVFELKIACYMILKKVFPDMEIKPQQIASLTLRSVQEKCGVSIKESKMLAKKYINNVPYTRRHLINEIGRENIQALCDSRIGPEVWKKNTYFDIYRRALHVFTEVARVYEFVETCRDDKLAEEDKLQKLGRLLIDSDESLASDFDCSSPELYEVTSMAINLGAYGSRLTGAGWGGCTVSLVHKDKLEGFMKGMRAYFNQEKHPECHFPKGEDLSSVLFPVIPGAGATLFGLDGNVIEWE